MLIIKVDNSTSHVSDLRMVGDMGIISRGEDSDSFHMAVLSESDYVMNFPRVEMSNKSGRSSSQDLSEARLEG